MMNNYTPLSGLVTQVTYRVDILMASLPDAKQAL